MILNSETGCLHRQPVERHRHKSLAKRNLALLGITVRPPAIFARTTQCLTPPAQAANSATESRSTI
jgi:hypothetical protein